MDTRMHIAFEFHIFIVFDKSSHNDNSQILFNGLIAVSSFNVVQEKPPVNTIF